MKKKLLRWLAYGCSAVIILALAGILLIDTIAKSVAERRVRAETGMDARIGKFTVGLRSSTIHIENFVLKNPAEFGGDAFVEMPELFLDYDRAVLRSGKLHLKLVRINIAKIQVVENKEGNRNIDALQKQQRKSGSLRKSTGGSAQKSEKPFAFDGIDTLDVTLKTVQFTSFKNPDQNLEQDLGINHEMLKNLKTDLDFQTAGAFLLLKASLSGGLNFDALFKPSSKAGRKTKTIPDEISEPLSLNPTNP